MTINQSGASVKLVRYTFTDGTIAVNVCYANNPVAIVNCSGSFAAIPSGANQVFPTATVVLPCSSGNLVMTGSTSAQGASTCTTQTVFSGPLPVKMLDAQSATVRLHSEAGVELPITITKTGDANLVSVVARSPLAKGIYLLNLSSADNREQKSLKVIVQ